MGIGTSLGAFFETELDHHAGSEYETKEAKAKGVNPNLLDNSIYPDEGDGPRFDRFREDEPGINQLLKNRSKGYKDDPNDSIDKNPDQILGIVPTHDNNVIPYDMLYRAPGGLVHNVSDIKTASPLVTITDEDIDKGMGLALSFSGGGLSTEGKVLQMRKPANDNIPTYNPREPNMIGSKELDDEMISSWHAFVDKQQKITDLYGERAKLHDIRKERDWSDIDLARFNKIGKEINEVSGDNYAVTPLDQPLKKYEYAKDLDGLMKEFKEVFDKLEK